MMSGPARPSEAAARHWTRLPGFGGAGEAVMTDRVQLKAVEVEGEGVARAYTLDAECARQEGVLRPGQVRSWVLRPG
jgi:hypothetical protein